MCGIYCHVSRNNKQCSCKASASLQNRGPDGSDRATAVTDGVEIEFEGCVLRLRGARVVRQPVRDPTSGNVLLWNGEIFGGLEVVDDESDTLKLFASLNECDGAIDGVLDVFSRIKGPWAFVYWQHAQKKLWFGRDYFGRRSLLWSLDDEGDGSCLTLSSVACGERVDAKWTEVPCVGLFALNVESFDVDCHRWSPDVYERPVETEGHEADDDDGLRSKAASRLKIKEREPNVKCVNVDKFETAFTPDAGSETYGESLETYVERQTVKDFVNVLSDSVRLRVNNKPNLCARCQRRQTRDASSQDRKDVGASCQHSKVSVLFSGGIDSCILALLADRFVSADEPIDLLNVAFEGKKTRQRIGKGQRGSIDASSTCEAKDAFEVPDRVTGRIALDELRKLNPHRAWNFIEVNVTIEELRNARNAIVPLLVPANTVLDDSIGCALWFASRGSGFVDGKLYNCPAKVVLVGMGADEQLAGYSRHRVKFKTGGWKGLVEEMSMEMRRISLRNLGRDDRIISSHGRESRLPYLDEDVVSFLNKLPVWSKADLNLPRGVGEKILLRVVAWSLGLRRSALFPKRAIQFGSRIAKAEDHREKGSDVCKRT